MEVLKALKANGSAAQRVEGPPEEGTSASTAAKPVVRRNVGKARSGAADDHAATRERLATTPVKPRKVPLLYRLPPGLIFFLMLAGTFLYLLLKLEFK